jgi:hypothetical protein
MKIVRKLILVDLLSLDAGGAQLAIAIGNSQGVSHG